MTSVAGHDHIVARCLAVDLEVGRRDHRIHAFAAVRADSGERLICSEVSTGCPDLKHDRADGCPNGQTGTLTIALATR